MKLTVITPVGPGHEETAKEAEESVKKASEYVSVFTEIEHKLIDDTKGVNGRSASRNTGIQSADSEWVFFLDADDTVVPGAFGLFDVPDNQNCVAVFGQVYVQTCASVGVSGAYLCGDQWVTNTIIPQHPLTNGWDDLINQNVIGTLSMGAFYKTSALKDNLFLPDLDAGEDFEFYLNLFSKFDFVKLAEPLVLARTKVKSAVGPRGYEQLDWQAACMPYVEFWRRRGRVPLSSEMRSTRYWEVR